MANRELIVKARLSSLSDKERNDDNGNVKKGRYATLVFEKGEYGDQAQAIMEAMKSAMMEEFGKVIKPKHPVLKDGDTETRNDNDTSSPTFGQEVLISDTSEHLKHAYYMSNVKADKLVLYNTHKRVIAWDDFIKGDQDIYTGCYVQAKINISVYSNQYGPQVSKYVNAMALLKDGDRIVGSGSGDTSADGFTFASDNSGSSDDSSVSVMDLF